MKKTGSGEQVGYFLNRVTKGERTFSAKGSQRRGEKKRKEILKGQERV